MEQISGVHGIDMAFPLTYFIFGLGFMLVLILECMAHALKKRHQGKNAQSQVSFGSTTDEVLSPPHLMVNPITSNASARTYDTIPMHVDHPAPSNPPLSRRSVTHAHLDEFSTLESVDFVAIVIFFGLSFHSIMEGLAIGASSKPVWDILVAIVAHKGLAAFALGQELLHHRVVEPFRFRFAIFLFSLMTPLGIAIGATILGQGKGETLLSGICSALAGGTFLYVTVMEILPQELQDPVDRNWKCVCFALGYCAFSSLAIWT